MNQTYMVLNLLALNDPRSNFGPKIKIQNDGKFVFACISYPGHPEDFINLQESHAGFGNTKKEAVVDLLKDMNMACQKAMWTGFGAPAGVCGAPAYMSDAQPNSISHMLSHECARCPKHGGFDVEAAAALALMYRSFGATEEF